MRELVQAGMDFAYFRPRPRGLAHFLGARLFTHGLPRSPRGSHRACRAASRARTPARLPLLVARAGGGSCRFAQPGRSRPEIALLIRIAILLAGAFEIPASLKISAAVAVPAPVAAVAAPRIQAGLQARFQVGAESGF